MKAAGFAGVPDGHLRVPEPAPQRKEDGFLREEVIETPETPWKARNLFSEETNRHLSEKINRYFSSYLCHVARRRHSLALLKVEGKVEGKPKRWVDQTKNREPKIFVNEENSY